MFSIAPLQSASSAVQMSTAMGEGSNSQSSRARGKSLADSAFESLSTPPSQFDIGQRDFGSMDWVVSGAFCYCRDPNDWSLGRIQANAAATTRSTPSRSQTTVVTVVFEPHTHKKKLVSQMVAVSEMYLKLRPVLPGEMAIVADTESLQSPASESVLRSSKRPRGRFEAPTEAHGPGSLTLRCDLFECACVLCHRLPLFRLEL